MSMSRNHCRMSAGAIAALLFAATVINYIDRQTLSVLASEITEELGISDIEYAQVVQAFLICYAAMYIVWGRIIDRWGTRVALAVSMVWWSLANAGHALSRGALGLGVFRALLGLGESGNFLAAEKRYRNGSLRRSAASRTAW